MYDVRCTMDDVIRALPGFFLYSGMKIFFSALCWLLLLQPAYAQCDPALRPVVFVHGFLASGDTWSEPVRRFREAGYCRERLFVFDWNTVGGNGKKNDSLLAAFIDHVLLQTGASQIDLVGHSAGGGLARGYLIDTGDARKVAHYVHIGSRKWFTPYAWFPNDRCLNIYSAGDKVAGSSAGAVEGAVNLDLKDQDHYQVATSRESFEAMYRFFQGGLPAEKKFSLEQLSLSGRAVLLGDNWPLKAARISLYALDRKTGQRKGKKAIAVMEAGEQGSWGPVAIQPATPYELELVPADSADRIISYYFPPFRQGDDLVYLRGFPKGNMVAGMLGKLPSKEDQAALVIYSSTRAMVGGRDSVTVNGLPLCSPLLTPASRTVISSFLFDDGDGQTSGAALKQYANAPFIGGADMLLPAGKKKVIRLYYNGQTLVLPARPSKERILLAVFR